MEKLYELHEDGGFDLIVVDTPPTRHALDFLDAPRAAHCACSTTAIFRLLMVPTRTGAARSPAPRCRRSSARCRRSSAPRSSTTSSRSSARSKGMEEGFRDARRRRSSSSSASRRPASCSSRRRAATRSRRRAFFAERIGDHDLAVDALIVNRVHPRFGDGALGRAASAGRARCASSTSRHGRERARATGSPRGTPTSPTSTRSPSASAATSRPCGSAARSAAVAFVPVPRPRRATTSTRSRRSASILFGDGRHRGRDRHRGRRVAFAAVSTILVAAEAAWVRDQVTAAFVGPGQRVVEVTRGQDVRDAVARARARPRRARHADRQHGRDRGARSTCGSRPARAASPTRDPAAARPRGRPLPRQAGRRRRRAREAGRRRAPCGAPSNGLLGRGNGYAKLAGSTGLDYTHRPYGM